MRITLLLLCSLLINTTLSGQATIPGTKPFVLGVTDQVKSALLKETRTLNIYLPAGYEKDTATYPVVYLLDGSADEDFVHIVGLVQFMNMIEMLPPCIVVGIGNVDRRRDFTFPTRNKKDLADYPTTGHSEAFISFVEQELQPYIQKKYHVNKQRTIIGQSLGGLVATEILLKKPSLFDQYIIVSPSLWWDDESLLAAAPGLLKANEKHGAIKAYISVGSEGDQMENDVKGLVKTLQQDGKNIHVLFAPLPGENHLTILHRSVYRAIELLYKR